MATHMQILTQDMGDEQRLADLAANDAAEAAAIQADLSRPTALERERRRIEEVRHLEETYHSRMGWLI